MVVVSHVESVDWNQDNYNLMYRVWQAANIILDYRMDFSYSATMQIWLSKFNDAQMSLQPMSIAWTFTLWKDPDSIGQYLLYDKVVIA